MKIWFQSGTGVGADKNLAPYLDSLARHAKVVSRPDSICEFYGQEKTYPMSKGRAAHNLAVRGYIRNAMIAEKQGFDVIMTNMLDLGVNEVREVVSIPVVGTFLANLCYTSQIAPNFAFITYSKGVYPWMVELAQHYGYKDRLVEGGFMDRNLNKLADLWGNPAPYLEQFRKLAGAAVSRGASAIITAGLYLSLWLMDQNIREVEGAVVIDTLAVGIKTAEMMVDMERLGIKRPRIGAYAPAAPDVKEVLAREFGVSQ